jgi:hypothetical protein
MADHTHAKHTHVHGPGCGHTAIRHDGHTDYVHGGHLHHVGANGSVTEHALPVSSGNPDGCRPIDNSRGAAQHSGKHVHGPGCGHEAVPHGDHVDYIVNGRLHHQHGDHCDDHGKVDVAKA